MFYWFSPALHITALLSLSILFMSGYFRSSQYTSETSTFVNLAAGHFYDFYVIVAVIPVVPY